MSIFQKTYNWIKAWTTPEWLKKALTHLWEKIIQPSIETIGEEGWRLIQKLILDASKKNISNEAKFKWVCDEFQSRWVETLSTRIVNLLVQLVFNQLKDQGFID